MTSRLTVIVSVAALALALFSGTMTVLLHYADAQAVCTAKQDTNAEVRGFMSEIINDPKVNATQKAQTTGLVLKHFPIQSC